MRESKLEQWFRDYCKSQEVLCLKFVAPGTPGVPDRICIFNGKTLFVELKAEGKKPSAMQEAIHKLFRKYGLTVHWCDNKEDLIQLITKFKQ